MDIALGLWSRRLALMHLHVLFTCCDLCRLFSIRDIRCVCNSANLSVRHILKEPDRSDSCHQQRLVTVLQRPVYSTYSAPATKLCPHLRGSSPRATLSPWEPWETCLTRFLVPVFPGTLLWIVLANHENSILAKVSECKAQCV